MKHELIMSSLLILGNPIMANAQQTKTTTAESISAERNSTAKNISTDSIQAMKGGGVRRSCGLANQYYGLIPQHLLPC